MSFNTFLATSLMDLFQGKGRGACEPINFPGDENTIWIAICNFLGTGLYWLFVIAGIGAIIMIIWGGYRLLTSGGDIAKIEEGKKTILWALIGISLVGLARLAIVFLAQLIQPSTPIPPGLV